MAAETEIERLVVRLTGDTSDYAKKMDDAAKTAAVTAKSVETSTSSMAKASEADLQKIADLYGLSIAKVREMGVSVRGVVAPPGGVAGPGGVTKEFQKNIDAAVDRHNAEKHRLLQEELRIVQRRENVENRAAAEAQHRMASARERHDQFGADDTQLDIPFKKAHWAVSAYHRAMEALIVVYAAKKVAEAAMMVSQEELNDQMEKAAGLQHRLIEVGSYHESQSQQKASSLPVKERVAFLNEELKKTQQIASLQREAVEAAEKNVQKARAPKSELGLAGEGVASGVGYIARTLDLGGRGSQYEQAQQQKKDAEQVLDQTREAVKKKQRELAEIGEGGDHAEQALSRFKTRMEEQTEAVGKGHKALALYRLEHDNNFTPEMLKKAEEYYDTFQRTTEAYHERVRVTEEWGAAEDKLYERIDKTTKEFLTPLEKFAVKKAELDEELGRGLGQEAYNRAIDDARKKYDAATVSADKFKSANASLFGGGDARAAIAAQVEMLAKPGAGKDAKGEGPSAPLMVELLKKVAANTDPTKRSGGTVLVPADVN